MSNKSIKLNLVMNIIVTVLGVVFPLVTFPYVSRVLGPTGTGAVSYAASIASYFSILAMLGVGTYGIKACAEVKNDKDKLSKTVQEIMFILCFSMLISYFLFFWIIKLGLIDTTYKNVIYIYGVGIVLQVIGMEWLYKAMEQYAFIALRSIVIKAISIVLMFVLIREKSDYPMYAVVNVFADGGAQLINFALSFRYIKRKRYRNYEIKKHISPLFVFFLTNVVHLIYTNLDIIMLEHIRGIYEVGIYNMALRIENILLSIVTALGVVILPQLSVAIKEKRYDDFNMLNKKALNYTTVIALFCVGVFEIIAPETVRILGGSEYEDAIILLRILLIVLFVAGIANISGLQILIPLGKEKEFLISVVWGAIIDFGLNVLLIKHLGNKATAISTVCAEIMVFVVQLLYLKKNKIELPRLNIQPFVICSISCAITFLLKKTFFLDNNISYCIVIGMTYGVVWLLLSFLFKEPIILELMKTFVKKIRR